MYIEFFPKLWAGGGSFLCSNTAQKMKFSIKDFFSKYGQIRRILRIWSHLRKKSLMETTSCFMQWKFAFFKYHRFWLLFELLIGLLLFVSSRLILKKVHSRSLYFEKNLWFLYFYLQCERGKRALSMKT